MASGSEGNAVSAPSADPERQHGCAYRIDQNVGCSDGLQGGPYRIDRLIGPWGELSRARHQARRDAPQGAAGRVHLNPDASPFERCPGLLH